MSGTLGELEQLVLLALARLGEHAYGVSVREELARRARRELSLGTIYTTLGRLEAKRLIASHLGDPTPERGGRRKKFYRLLPAGHRALLASLHAIERMAAGLHPLLERS